MSGIELLALIVFNEVMSTIFVYLLGLFRLDLLALESTETDMHMKSISIMNELKKSGYLIVDLCI